MYFKVFLYKASVHRELYIYIRQLLKVCPNCKFIMYKEVILFKEDTNSTGNRASQKFMIDYDWLHEPRDPHSQKIPTIPLKAL